MRTSVLLSAHFGNVFAGEFVSAVTSKGGISLSHIKRVTM